ncbi:MAG: hypothetical protein M3N38_05200 [Pseudomonadota bacterium]|nr:hypothetical protein [Pseudomonadota bacterium]
MTTRLRPDLRALGYVASSMLAVVLLLLLQSCSPGNQPFQKSLDGSVRSSGKTPPPITLKTLRGIPDDKAKMFSAMLADAAARRDVAVVEGAFPDSFWLSGVFRVQANSAGTVVSYQWKLDDGAGKPLHSFSGLEQAGVSSGNPWDAVFPDVLRRIAAGTTENLASRLAQMGFATRTAGLPPPALSFALASSKDAQEIDLETMYGPGKAPAEGGEVAALTAADPQAPQAAPDAPAPSAATDAPAPSAATDAPPPSAATGSLAPKPQRAEEEIRAIALTSVVGSPANDDAALRGALKAVLVGAGWPVVDKPQPDALTVTGRVSVDAPKDGKQQVALAWNVRAPSGRDLGTVRQSNAVAAGSLASGWSDAAGVVAEAAAEGLFDLVRRLR